MKKNNSTPLITIVIPNYNHANFLEQRLNSIINQTYNNTEIIVLDDASTDDSIKILKKYKDKFNKLVINKNNSGTPFKQWDKGISMANGEWVYIAESDDYCDKNLLQTLIDNAKQYPDIVLSYCKSLRVDKNNKPVNIPQFQEKNKCMNGKTFIKKRLFASNDIPNSGCAIFKKSAYTKISKAFTQYKVTGDKRFWAEIALQGNVAISTECLNYFRQHHSSTSSNADKKMDFYLEDKQTHDFIIKNNIVKKNSILDNFAKASYCNLIKKDNVLSEKEQDKIFRIWEYKKYLGFIPWFFGDLYAQGPIKYSHTLIKYFSFLRSRSLL